MTSDRICLGVITGSFGVRGEARIKSFCAEASAIGDYGPLTNEAGTVNYKLTITRPVKEGFAARLSGVPSKEQADALKGTKLFAPRSALPALPDDEYYYTDLIGLDAMDTGGQKIGKITAVHDHGAGDILEVALTGGAGTTLVPFTLAIVPTVDLATGRVIIDLVEDPSTGPDDA